jgi:hypothetical protein
MVMDMEEKPQVLFSEKYSESVLAHFIKDKDYCTKADHFIKTTLSLEMHNLPHEIPCPCLVWKTKELPINSIKGDQLDTVRILALHNGKGLVEFIFNSGKYRYSICRLHSVHRIERTDHSLIVVTQNAVVPCSEIIIFGKYQLMYHLNIEGHKEVLELDKFLTRLRKEMLE